MHNDLSPTHTTTSTVPTQECFLQPPPQTHTHFSRTHALTRTRTRQDQQRPFGNFSTKTARSCWNNASWNVRPRPCLRCTHKHTHTHTYKYTQIHTQIHTQTDRLVGGVCMHVRTHTHTDGWYIYYSWQDLDETSTTHQHLPTHTHTHLDTHTHTHLSFITRPWSGRYIETLLKQTLLKRQLHRDSIEADSIEAAAT